jgi:hypothetical protein
MRASEENRDGRRRRRRPGSPAPAPAPCHAPIALVRAGKGIPRSRLKKIVRATEEPRTRGLGGDDDAYLHKCSTSQGDHCWSPCCAPGCHIRVLVARGAWSRHVGFRTAWEVTRVCFHRKRLPPRRGVDSLVHCHKGGCDSEGRPTARRTGASTEMGGRGSSICQVSIRADVIRRALWLMCGQNGTLWDMGDADCHIRQRFGAIGVWRRRLGGILESGSFSIAISSLRSEARPLHP